MTVGEKIRSIRKALGYTQRDFAERIKVSHITLNRYENNKVIPSIKVIERITTEFRVPSKLLVQEHNRN